MLKSQKLDDSKSSAGDDNVLLHIHVVWEIGMRHEKGSDFYIFSFVSSNRCGKQATVLFTHDATCSPQI